MPHQPLLVVLLHGYTRTPESLADVEREVRDALGPLDVWTPRLPAARWSAADPSEIALEILRGIDERWASGRFEQIVLVGHSLGALLARKVYVLACGAHPDAPFETAITGCDAARPWAAAVQRIVLLAGMNRGWSISHHMGLGRATVLTCSWWIARVSEALRRRCLLIAHVRRGSAFLTNLRIQWLRMRQRAALDHGAPGSASVVQLLGTVDDLVAPTDNIDLIAGRDFYYFDVPASGHSTVVAMDHTADGRRRAEIFRRALLEDRDGLAALTVQSDYDVPPQRTDVTDVVFVMHGIRDVGHWTQRIAREVISRARADDRERAALESRVFAMETSTYGYFGMAPFLFPGTRRAKVEWFMDRYASAIALYPHARRHYFVGHSNGTYLLARALREYRCCRFERVVFAGSVVPSRYDWESLVLAARPRVRGVLNLIATADWVVAVFPSLFERWGSKDLGGAGHDGFRQARALPAVAETRFVRGGHGAAIHEPWWRAIAAFLLHGEVPNAVALDRSAIVALLGFLSPLVWATLAVLVCFGAVWVSGIGPAPIGGALVVVYGLLVWKILTRL